MKGIKKLKGDEALDALTELRGSDYEDLHREADFILLGLLLQHGYTDVVYAFLEKSHELKFEYA